MFIFTSVENAQKFVERDKNHRVAVYAINKDHENLGVNLKALMPPEETVRAVRDGQKSVKSVVKDLKKTFAKITKMDCEDRFTWNLIFSVRTLMEIDRHRSSFTIFIKPYSGDTDEEKKLNKLYREWISTILDAFGKKLFVTNVEVKFVLTGKAKGVKLPKELKKGKSFKVMLRRMVALEDGYSESCSASKLAHGEDLFKFISMYYLPEVKALTMYKFSRGNELNLHHLAKKDVRSIADGICSAYCGASTTKMNDAEKKFKAQSVKSLLKSTKRIRQLSNEFIDVLVASNNEDAVKVAKKLKRLKVLKKTFKSAKQQKKYMKTFNEASKTLAKNKYILFALVEYICRRRNGDGALSKNAVSGCATILSCDGKNNDFATLFTKTAKEVKDKQVQLQTTTK